MKVISFLGRVFPIILALLLIWCSALVYTIIRSGYDQQVNSYVPSNANMIFKFNSKDFFKESVHSLLFNSKDQQLLDSFRSFLEKRRKGTGKSTDYGINFLADVTVFGESFQSGQCYVVLFQLIEPKKFEKNMPHQLSKNQSMALHGNIGAMVTYFGDQMPDKQRLTKYAENLFKNKNEQQFHFSDEELFHTTLSNYQVNDELQINHGDITSSIDENEFLIKGELGLKFKARKKRRWSLIPALSDNPLHIENSIFSKVMQDSIQAYMEKMGISSPPINHVSVNYYGVKLQFTEKTENGIIVTPMFDLIVTFDKKYELDQIFKNSKQIEKFGFERINNAIIAGNVKYKIREIDSTTLFIGNNNEMIIKRNKNDLFKISGDISKLTRFEGGGFFLNAMLSAYPPYKASKDLFESIERVRLTIKPENKKIIIDGRIQFHEDRYLFNDILKFYLNMKGEY